VLKLYNSLTQKTEPFTPMNDKAVKMYTCGPSTYQRPHIGNYRTFLFEDILQRYLEYKGYPVTRLMTLTNIEDKAIVQAFMTGLTVEQLTSRNESLFFHDFQNLRIKRPDLPIRASTIVDQAVDLTKTLLDKGVAYRYRYHGAENVYFDPLKFKGFGKLAHLDMSKWPKERRRFHLDTYPGTPWNLGDFVLWRGCKANERVCWDTELGRGRPAWNLQDAAIVTKHLGFSVDVACGGVDNLVRHHDYTLAVAESVSGKPFARYWLHGGHLFVDGKKMSKSLGNVLYPEHLTEKGYSNQHIRFFLIYGPYREKRNFTWQNLLETSKKLDAFKAAVEELKNADAKNSDPKAKALAERLQAVFERGMDDNLDVKAAFDELHKTLLDLNNYVRAGKLSAVDSQTAINRLRAVDQVLQVIFE